MSFYNISQEQPCFPLNHWDMSHRFYSPFSDQALQLIFFKQYLWKIAVGQRTVTESLQGAQAVIGSQVADKAYVHLVQSDVVFCSHAAGKIHSTTHELKKKIVLNSKAQTKRRKQNSSHQLKSPLENGCSKVQNMQNLITGFCFTACALAMDLCTKILINEIQAVHCRKLASCSTSCTTSQAEVL